MISAVVKKEHMPTFKTKLPNHFDLPRRINRLGELSYNLWWAWNPMALRLFNRIDNNLWESVNHSPIRFLRTLEHRLQMMEDEQTHSVPKEPHELAHTACFMGFADAQSFGAALLSRLDTVQGHYARLFERAAPLAVIAPFNVNVPATITRIAPPPGISALPLYEPPPAPKTPPPPPEPGK